MGYGPFPVLCHDTAIVLGQEEHAPARTTEDLHERTCSSVPGEAYRDRPLWVLCRDRVVSPCVATGVFKVATGFYGSWGLVSRHGLGVATVMLRRGLVSRRDNSASVWTEACHDIFFLCCERVGLLMW